MKTLLTIMSLMLSLSSFANAEKFVLENGTEVNIMSELTDNEEIVVWCASGDTQSIFLPNYQGTKACAKKYALMACKDRGYDNCEVVRREEHDQMGDSFYSRYIFSYAFVKGSKN